MSRAVSGNYFVALGGGGGHKLGALVQTKIKRLPPFFFAELRCKKGPGAYDRASTVYTLAQN